jgi:hypothetical protein
MLFFVVLSVALSGWLSCSGSGSETQIDPAFKNYWYNGEAELNRYELKQARYGEMRDGEAVLIFVTEPFLKDKQVKYEYGDDENAISVLKLNFTRKFYTGIYPYSMMSSTFTPVNPDEWPTIKITASIQEWCGHTYMQLNRDEDDYRIEHRSYFQAEGDRNYSIAGAMPEDEIWTRARMAPESLPTGKVEIIPGVQFIRLKHIPAQPEEAETSLQEIHRPDLSTEPLFRYDVNYQKIDRKLTLFFEKTFPHSIVAWEETYKDGRDDNASVMTTKAVRRNSMMLDYWSKNKRNDSHLRREFGLTF